MFSKMGHNLSDLVLAAFSILIAVLLFVGSASLPPPRFEPLGSAAMPRGLGVIIVILSLIILTRALLNFRKSPKVTPDAENVAEGKHGPVSRQPSRSVLTFLALFVYIFLLDVLQAPFVPVTTLFFVATGLAIGESSVRSAAVFFGLGLTLAILISLTLSQFFYISL
jgi:putative tricarboxylic transport membrane protein